MTQSANVKIVHKTGSSMNKKQYAVGCEYIYTLVNGHQLTVDHSAGVSQELHNQFFAVRNGKAPWLTKAFVRNIHEIEHHDVVS
jgi:hypothetical protein